MKNRGPYVSRHGLDRQGFITRGSVFWNLPEPRLYEHAIRRGEAFLARHGVREPTTEGDLWWGKVNRPFAPESFNRILEMLRGYVQDRDLYVFDGYAGADPKYRLRVRVINENAWQNLFARNMFVRETDGAKLVDHEPEFTVVNIPSFRAAAPSTPARSRRASSR